MKKLLAIALTLVLVFTIVPFGVITASATTSGTTGQCTWTLDGTVLTISSGGNGKMESYSVSNSAPWGKEITKVIINDGIINIGDYSFFDSPALSEVEIANSVKYIGSHSFLGCTSLENVTLRHGVVHIGDSAFEYCENLKTVKLPKTLVGISRYAFNGCNSLTDVYYDGTKSQRDDLPIYENNSNLLNPTWHYATCKHKYDNDCDSTCNYCGKERSANHVYVSKKTAATTSKNGKKYYECCLCGETTKSTTIYKVSKVYLSTTKYTYNGNTKKPSVKIYDSKGKKLTYGKDYVYKRPKASKNVGKYTIKVTFMGNYSGTKNLYYTINPPKTSVSSLTAGKKSLKVKINKQSSQTKGYQIEYSTSKTFKSKYTKKKTITSYKTTSYTLKSLKAKKTYYVRVRTYKKVDGKYYYSAWSSVKSKKTK